MSSLYTSTEVSLRTRARRERGTGEGRAVRVTARAPGADLKGGAERWTDKKHAMQIYGSECCVSDMLLP